MSVSLKLQVLRVNFDSKLNFDEQTNMFEIFAIYLKICLKYFKNVTFSFIKINESN